MWDSIPEPQDLDLSWRQPLNHWATWASPKFRILDEGKPTCSDTKGGGEGTWSDMESKQKKGEGIVTNLTSQDSCWDESGKPKKGLEPKPRPSREEHSEESLRFGQVQSLSALKNNTGKTWRTMVLQGNSWDWLLLCPWGQSLIHCLFSIRNNPGWWSRKLPEVVGQSPGKKGTTEGCLCDSTG